MQFPDIAIIEKMTEKEQQEICEQLFLASSNLSSHNFHSLVPISHFLSKKYWFIELLLSYINKNSTITKSTYFDFLFLTYSQVENKELFLYFFSNFPHFDFFKNNVLKFQYSKEEKNILIESFYHKHFFWMRSDVKEEELENQKFIVSVFDNICVIPRLLQTDINDSDSNYMVDKFNSLIKYFPFIEKIDHKLSVIFICFFNVYIKNSAINPLFHDLYFKFCELFNDDIEYILNNLLNDESKKSQKIKEVTQPIFEKIQINKKIENF